MTIEEVESLVHACSKIGWPRELRYGRDGEKLNARQKVEVMEDFMLVCAEARNRCEDARIVIAGSLRLVRQEWEDIEGWEVNINGSASKATGPQIDAAKRKARPDLWPSITKGEFLLRRLNEQISRFAKNEETISRLYTFVTGSG